MLRPYEFPTRGTGNPAPADGPVGIRTGMHMTTNRRSL